MSRYWCYHCYGLNSRPRGACAHCGGPVEGPPGRSYDDQLIWALSHPDGDRALLAVRMLGARHVRIALPALRKLVEESPDPYRASAALRSAIAIAGVDELRPWLEQLLDHRSFMVSTIARSAADVGGAPGPS